METQVKGSQMIESYRDKAEIYHGVAPSKQKVHELLEGLSLPKGLLPLDVDEIGHDRSSGFVWMKQKSKKEYRLRNITGVKMKEMILWIAICEIYLQDPPSDKVVIAVPGGLSRTFPVAEFELEDDKPKGQKNKN
ncbi:hypothetical protein FH972_000949 [Carpinus fangiana]|uniref:Uncharacterized protein n=1 Tax=Carpinus fangiana TaxID=176857 RepID=A0A5N6QA91_9ROSI|nr:hypothetical protein FH972_000949 [Carpinus fangiana]